MAKKDINEGISCNVRNCVYNEHGCDCNLERVCISRGEGGHHFCKSYISINDEEENTNTTLNVESGEEFFNYKNLNDITDKDD